MKQIYIVEDNARDSEILKKHIEKFSKEEGVECKVTVFKDGVHLLDNYRGRCDVIFADIEMPYMNGLTTIRKLRLVDPKVPVVFVTNMAQYAIDGYEVNALDFIVKPVEYFNFKMKLKKALRYGDANCGKSIFIDNGTESIKLALADVLYIEKEHNYAVYHTIFGEYRERATLTEIETRINDPSMARCNSGCLVNYRHVASYTNSTLTVGDDTLSVSRGKQKEFFDGLIAYFGRRRGE